MMLSWKMHKESDSLFGWRTTNLLIIGNLVDVSAPSLWKPRGAEPCGSEVASVMAAPESWPVLVGSASRSAECCGFLPEIPCRG